MVSSAATTDAGKVRECNEDAFLNLPDRKIWAVADGMGGHESGEIASRMIVEALSDIDLAEDFDERINQVRHCLHVINKQLVHAKTVIRGQQPTIIGSTAVVLLVEDYRAACIWAGDSRCYLFRKGSIYQVTKDHAVWQEQMDKELLTQEEAQQIAGSFALTRAIGAEEELALEVVEMEAEEGDKFLLCSDGVYQYISYEQLYFVLNKRSPRLAVEQLAQDVLETPAKDNLTAVVVAL